MKTTSHGINKDNSRMRPTLMLFAAALFFTAMPAPALAGNIIAESIITASSLPNPAWAPENVGDGDVGPTKGWLGEWSDTGAELWLQFSFSQPEHITGIRLMQAGLTQAGRNRFARPRKVKITFFTDKASTNVTATLEDRELIFQNVEITPTDAKTIKIEVLEAWPGSRIKNMAGFQEIEIITDKVKSAATDSAGKPIEMPKAGVARPADPEQGGRVIDPRSAAVSSPETAANDAPADTSAGEQSGGGSNLSQEEKEILELLSRLMEKLEKQFAKD